jgi:MFS family permease
LSADLIQLLRNRAVVQLWLAQSVSVLGDMLTFLALPMLVYEATGSKAALSMTIFAGGLPAVLLGPFAGAWVDRKDRKRIMVFSDLARGIVTLPILLVGQSALIPTIYLVVAVKSVLGSFFQPAMSAVIPGIVKREQLMTVNAAFTLSLRSLQFLAPLAGVVLIGAMGLRWVLLIDVASFGISALLIAVTRLPSSAGKADGPLSPRQLLADIRTGLGWIRRSGILKALLATGIIIQLGQGFISPVWLPYIVEVLGRDKEAFGLLVSLQGLGCVVGSLVLLLLGKRLAGSVKRTYMLLLAGAGITIFLQVTTTSFPVFLGWATLAGLFLAGRGATTQTLIHQAADANMLGRISSTLSIMNRASLMLAVALVGLTAGKISTRGLFVIACSLYLFGSLLGTLLTGLACDPSRDTD